MSRNPRLTPAQIRSLEIAVEMGQLSGVAVDEFRDGTHLLQRSTRELSLWNTDRAAYFRAWRARNPQRAKEITERYRLKMLAEKPQEFAASRHASRRRHAEKVGPTYFRTAARAERAAKRKP